MANLRSNAVMARRSFLRIKPTGASELYRHDAAQPPARHTAQSGFVHRLTKCSKHADQIILLCLTVAFVQFGLGLPLFSGNGNVTDR